MNIIKKKNTPFVYISLSISVLIFFLLCYFQIIRINDWKKMIIPSIGAIILSFLLLKKIDINTYSNTYLYLIYSTLSLFGFIILFPFFPDIKEMRSEFTMSFLNYSELTKAIIISSISIITFSLFSYISYMKIKIKINKIEINNFEDSNPQIAKFAIVVLLVVLMYLLFYLITNKDYISNYASRVETINTLFNHMEIFMSLSFVILVSFGSKKQIKKGIVIFFICSIINFLLGNRGEIYYPVFAALAVYSKRNGKISKKIIISLLISSLLLISFIRVFRNSNETKLVNSNLSLIKSSVESIGEMGFQIAPLTYMLNYIETTNNYQFGKTYIYSFQQFTSRYVPFIQSPDTLNPASIVAIMPANGYGFTNVGEFYYNFGLVGVIIGSILLSKYLAYFSIKRNKYINLFNDLFFIEIIALIRNSSSTFPVYLVWCIVFTIITYFYESINKTRLN